MPARAASSSGRIHPGTIQSPEASTWAPARRRSCSSATSPTISSTASSRVTTPAVPPYSSTTRAIWLPAARSSTSSEASGMVSGTRGTGVMREEEATDTAPRRS